jgi:hypothetical protein
VPGRFPGSRLPYSAARLKPLSEAAVRGDLGTRPPSSRCLGCALGIDRVYVLLQRLGLRLALDVELKRSLRSACRALKTNEMEKVNIAVAQRDAALLFGREACNVEHVEITCAPLLHGLLRT